MDRKKIPGTKDFTINTKGIIFDPKGKERKTYINGCGYITSTVKTKEKGWVTFGVHRLNCLTHKPERLVERTEVNHRDGIISNNDISNLEWVTPRENIIHAEIMRTDNMHLCVYSSSNGVPVRRYQNALEASLVEGCKVLDVWDSIKEGKKINGIHFHFLKRSTTKPKELNFDRTKNFTSGNRQPPKAIRMLDVLNGDILDFKSIHEAGINFSVSPSHIHCCIKEGTRPRLFLKRYQVQYACRDFPVMSEEELLDALGQGPKKVLAYNTVTKGLSIFDSASSYIRYTKLSKKAVTVSLRNNRVRQIGDWVALYKTPENEDKLKSFLSVPAVT